MDDLGILQELVAAIARAWKIGSPIAPYDEAQQHELARLALRRWRSFSRRNKVRRPTHDRLVEDLAKGLRDFYEEDRHLVGPLITDYRYLARVLAAVLAAPPEQQLEKTDGR